MDALAFVWEKVKKNISRKLLQLLISKMDNALN